MIDIDALFGKFSTLKSLSQNDEDIVDIDEETASGVCTTLKVEGGNVVLNYNQDSHDDYYGDLGPKEKDPTVAMEFSEYYSTLKSQVASKTLNGFVTI